MLKLHTKFRIAMTAVFLLFATPAGSASLEADQLAVEPFGNRPIALDDQYGMEAAPTSGGRVEPSLFQQMQPTECPPFQSVEGFTHAEIQAIRALACVDEDADGMPWWAFFAITAIAISSVPVLATQREALDGSSTTSLGQLDDRRSLLMPAGLMFSIWLLALIYFVT